MARIWSFGAEEQSNTSGMEADTFTGTTSISTSTKRSGNAALRCNPSAATGFVQHKVAAADTAPWWVRGYFYFASLPSSGTTAIIRVIDNTNVNTASIRLTSAGKLQLFDDSLGTQIGADSSTLSTATWYRIELNIDGTAGATARIDGTNFATTGTGLNNGQNLNQFVFGCITSTTADIYVDDVAINDSTGSAQTSWPGAGSIVHIYPNASGDNNQWLKSGGGAGDSTNYQDCDETTPDDATTYLKRTATGTFIDDYNCPSSSSAGIGSGDTITLIAIGNRSGSLSTTSTGRSLILRIKSAASGTVSESAAFNINTNGWHSHKAAVPRVHQHTSYTDPTTAVAWTPTGTNSVDNMQIGFKNGASSANEIRVTTVWALVEYVPAATTPISGSETFTLSESNTTGTSSTDSGNLTDTGSAIDSGSTPITGSDSATATDTTVTISSTLSATETYTLTEATSTTISSSDSFTLSDSSSISVVPTSGNEKYNNLEGLTDETTITTANSGTTSGTAFDAVSGGTGSVRVGDTAQAAHGTVSMRTSTGTTSTTSYVQWTVTPNSSSEAGGRTYFRFSSLPSGATPRTIVNSLIGTTQQWTVQYSSTGHPEVVGTSASDLLFRWEGGADELQLAVDTWYRLEWFVKYTTTGHVDFRFYLGDGTTALNTWISNWDMSGGIDRTRFGVTRNAANQTQQWQDDLVINDFALPGPAVVSKSSSETYTLTEASSIDTGDAPVSKSGSETFTATESSAVYINVSDSATVADTSVSTSIDATESAILSDETSLVSITATESFALSESNVTGLSSTESHTLIESTVTNQSSSESFFLTDTNYISISVSDSPTLIESVLTSSDLAASDSHTLTETNQTGTSSTESYTLIESVSTAQAQTTTDTATLVESSVIGVVTSDQFAISEAVSSSSTLGSTDNLVVTEQTTTGISVTDSHTLIEASGSIAFALSTMDSATLTDTSAFDIPTTLAASDSATLTDVIVNNNANISATETPVLSESTSQATSLAANDSATLSELIEGGVGFPSSDAGALTEVNTIQVQYSRTDAFAGNETSSQISAPTTASEFANLTESSQISATDLLFVYSTDSALLTDQSTLSSALTAFDTQFLAESNITSLTTSDAITFAEATRTVGLTSSDDIVFTDTKQLSNFFNSVDNFILAVDLGFASLLSLSPDVRSPVEIENVEGQSGDASVRSTLRPSTVQAVV